jgi:ribosomal protein L30E
MIPTVGIPKTFVGLTKQKLIIMAENNPKKAKRSTLCLSSLLLVPSLEMEMVITSAQPPEDYSSSTH